jgi:hypothetical protein
MSTGPNMKHRNATIAAGPLMSKIITWPALVDVDDPRTAGRSAFARDPTETAGRRSRFNVTAQGASPTQI